jgi:hypothetical protein
MRILNGLPTWQGVTDFADSCVYASILTLVSHPDRVNMLNYLANGGMPTRHPNEPHNNSNSPWTFSRDQGRCFMAGVVAQHDGNRLKPLYAYIKSNGRYPNWMQDDGSKKWYGGDFALPHDIGCLEIALHLQRRLTKWQGFWLKAEIKIQSIIKPLHEPTQLICLCAIAGPEYVDYFRKTYSYRDAIALYFSSWRQEHNLGVKLYEYVRDFK